MTNLEAKARAAEPPDEDGDLHAPELVNLRRAAPDVRLDVRYATTDNVMGVPLYEAARVFLQRPAAEALEAANRSLAADDLGLFVWDGYRPWYVTKWMREAAPERFYPYLADPADGSRHNRGCAVDLTLCERASGRPLPMPSAYDDFSERAHADWPGASPEAKRNRARLRRAMEAHGFEANAYEWWHFDFEDWRAYPIMNTPVQAL
jgi:D-alanyl-D-alanine dipeptidase